MVGRLRVTSRDVGVWRSSSYICLSYSQVRDELAECTLLCTYCSVLGIRDESLKNKNKELDADAINEEEAGVQLEVLDDQACSEPRKQEITLVDSSSYTKIDCNHDV